MLALTILAAHLGGCGFELQGRKRLPEYMSVVHVDAEDQHTNFVRALKQTLKASGVRVADESEEAGTVVHVSRDDTGQSVLSVSARNTPEEYEVYYQVRYSVEYGGQEVLEPEELRLERNYAYDEAAVLAKQREEEQLRDAMARDLAARVMRRLATL
jgi:LPS-assembly lipoprotein